MKDNIWKIFYLYPTPGHLENISQLSIFYDFCGIAEIDVITAAVAS